MTLLAQKVRDFAREIGFDLVGFAPADALPAQERALRAWLEAGYAGDMAYMGREPARRADPRRSLPEARTVICLGLNYYPGEYPPGDGPKGRISRYAWGTDYHRVIEEKLTRISDYLRQEAGRPVRTKGYVDYGPLLERSYAARAGLGFIGKNTLLISPRYGSWVFLAELLTDLDLCPEASEPAPELPESLCGTCTLCLQACPTQAIVAPFELDATRCISYLTIESRREIPRPLRTRMEDWAFGCDICQEVCPYNHQASLTREGAFSSGAGPWLDLEEVLGLDEPAFKARFARTPLLRPKLSGLRRNAGAVSQNLEEENREGVRK